jgi:ribose transport system substrate-binding protein
MSTKNRSRTVLARTAVSVLGVAALVTLSACSGSGGAAGGGTGTVEGATVAIVGPQSGDPYYQEVACGARTEGAKLGMEVGEQQASQNQSQADQNTIMQGVLGKSPDAVIYTPADPVAGGIPVRTAKEDGITVINVDAQLDDHDLYDSFVSSDHYEGARELTKTLASLMGDEGEVAAVGSLPSNPITQARIKGFTDELEDHPGIELVSTSYPDVSPDAIQAEAAALLIKNPDLKAIYTTNYLNSTGAAVALRNADLVGDVKMVSWDTGAQNVKLMQEGVVQATVAQQPFTMGELAIRQIAAKIEGKEVEATVASPITILTSDDVDTPDGKALWYEGKCSA